MICEIVVVMVEMWVWRRVRKDESEEQEEVMEVEVWMETRF